MVGMHNGPLGQMIWVMVASLGLFLGILVPLVAADPTWPSSTDDLEEIMYQLKAFRGRRFSE